MKYIKKLNINFNDWENYDDNDWKIMKLPYNSIYYLIKELKNKYILYKNFIMYKDDDVFFEEIDEKDINYIKKLNIKIYVFNNNLDQYTISEINDKFNLNIEI